VIRGRHAILTLLTALNLVNYFDRFVVMAVSPKIQQHFGLSDQETGWIATAFMFGYFLTSPIFGWLGDRYPRKGLIAIGVCVWSVATAASGFAESYAALLAARVAVGIGEASYATLSPTIIDDISSPATKNRWLAIFYVAIPVGSALGFQIGGALEHQFGWRWAFFLAGGPGVLLSFLALAIREPVRTHVLTATTGMSEYKQLAQQPLYVSTVAGYIAQTFVIGGFTAWATHFLYRKLNLELHIANFWFGTVTVVTGLVGTAIGGWIGDRWPGQNRARAYLRVCALSSIAATPLALVALFMPTATGFLIMLGLCELALFVSISPTNAAILASVPTALRATAMAVSIFMMHLLGDLISPPLIGAVSDHFGDKPVQGSGAFGLQIGMYTLPIALAVSAVLWWYGSSPARAPSLDGPAAGA
jgi:MFS transporter, Spinster family, sphingosine-1-phosphate transporter